VDDARGVGEPLNETLCGCSDCSCQAGGLPARGRHLITAGPAPEAAVVLRQAAQQLNDPVLLAFADLPQPPVAPSAAQEAEHVAAAGAGAGAGTRPGGDVRRTSTSAGTAATSSISGSMISRSAALLRGSTAGRSGALHNRPSQVHAGSHSDARAGLAPAAPAEQGIIAALGLQGRWTGLAAAVTGLPANVHLLTLMRADEGAPNKLILRLAHMFQVCSESFSSRGFSCNR
jgi:hypothetical protein